MALKGFSSVMVKLRHVNVFRTSGLSRAMMKVFILAAGFIVTTAPSAHAGSGSYTVTPRNMQFHEDRTGNLQFEDILKDGSKWQDAVSDYINFGYTRSSYWFRVRANRFMDLNAEYYIEINNPRIDNIEFYIPTAQGYTAVITGDRMPFRSRQVEDRNFVFRINGNPEGRDIFFKVSSNGSVKFRLFIYSSEQFISRLNREMPVLWIYFGILLFLFFYNLFFYIGTRDRISLYFAMFVASLALVELSLNGFSIQYLWPESVYLGDISLITVINLIILFVCIYVISFLNARECFVRYYMIMRYSVLYPAPVFGLMSVIIGIQREYLLILTAWVMYSVLIMMVFILAALARGFRTAWYLMAGFFIYFIGIILYALKDFNVIPYNALTEWSMQGGSASMVVIFTMGLVNRFNTLQMELASSEKKFRSYTESSPTAILLIDGKGNIKYANLSTAELSGYDETTLASSNIRDLLVPSEQEGTDEYLRDLMKNGRVRKEMVVSVKKGNQRHVIFDAAITGGDLFLLYGTDITYLKEIEQQILDQKMELQATMEELEATNEEFQAQNEALASAFEELEQKEVKLREMIRIAPYPIAAVERTSLEVSYNRRFSELLGYDENFTITSEIFWQNAFPDQEKKQAAIKKWESIAESLQGREGMIDPFEWDITSADGALKTIEVSIVALKDSYFMIINDLTEKKKTQEMMIQSEKMMSLGGLAAGMAHEINNPLGIILQGVQMIMNRISPEVAANVSAAREEGTDIILLTRYLERRKITSYLKEISEAGNRAARIITNMLAFSRKTSGEKVPVDINSLVENAITMASNDYDLKKKYDFKTISLNRNYSGDIPRVRCVPTEIEQVLLNLLKNSAQAMSELKGEGYSPAIKVTTRADDLEAVIIIGDNGPGMTREVLRHIFDPFFSTKGTGAGTGLGLSVSYFIITVNHKGMITADSVPGSGSEFTIRLPY